MDLSCVSGDEIAVVYVSREALQGTAKVLWKSLVHERGKLTLWLDEVSFLHTGLQGFIEEVEIGRASCRERVF